MTRSNIVTYLITTLLVLSMASLGFAKKEKDGQRNTQSSPTTARSNSVSTETLKQTVGTKPVDRTARTSTASPLAGEEINWQVLSGGATAASSASFILLGTVGQTAAGLVTSASYMVNQGYWQTSLAPPTGCCIGTMGSTRLDDGVTDCSDLSDQVVDVADLTNMIDHLFINFWPICCTDENDFAPLMYGGLQDGVIDVVDLTGMIDHLFINFPPMPPCP